MKSLFPLPSAVVTAFTVLVGAACSTSEGAATAGPTSGDAAVAEFACAHDPRVQTYVANLQKPGLLGKAMFSLSSADPAPPRQGLNEWTVKVTDAAGAALPGATMTISGVMPDHQHGWSTRPEIVAGGDGTTFTFKQMNLFMDGVWNVTIGVGDGAQTVDSATFTFCIGG